MTHHETPAKYLGHHRKLLRHYDRCRKADCRLFFESDRYRRGSVLPRSSANLAHLTGYREFNFQYLQQLKISKTEHTNLKNHSSRQVLRNYIQIRQQTEDLIDEKRLERVAQLIEKADRVYFFGTGSSGLVARDMKLRFMRLGVICEALTDADGFAWTTSILDKNCLVIGFSLSGQTPSIIDSLIDAKGMGAKTVLITGQPDLIKEDFSEIIPVAMQSKPQFIQRISAQFPMLLMIDILYAFFLEIDRERKEKIFNSYWENHKLNGYYRRHQ